MGMGVPVRSRMMLFVVSSDDDTVMDFEKQVNWVALAKTIGNIASKAWSGGVCARFIQQFVDNLDHNRFDDGPPLLPPLLEEEEEQRPVVLGYTRSRTAVQ